MTIVLISDGGAEQYACRLLADRLEQQGQSCLTIQAPRPPRASPYPRSRPSWRSPLMHCSAAACWSRPLLWVCLFKTSRPWIH